MDSIEMMSSINTGVRYAGSVAILVGWLTSGRTSVTSYIVGYSALSISIVMLAVMTIYKQMSGPSKGASPSDQFDWSRILAIVVTVLPFLLLLAVTVIMIILLATYGRFISEQHVAPGYYSRTTFIVAIVAFMLTFASTMLGSISQSWIKDATKKNTVFASAGILYLLSIFAAMTVYQIYVILKFFRTDGFSVIR
jgi:hypothetical protein